MIRHELVWGEVHGRHCPQLPMLYPGSIVGLIKADNSMGSNGAGDF